MTTKTTKLIMAIIGIIALTACSQQNHSKLRLGTNVWPGYEPLYLAKEIGVFPSEQVRLVEYPSASEVIQAFRNRSLEMASLTLDEVLLLVQDQIPVRVVLVHDISVGADTILARPGIKHMKDIVGKRVAVESSALGAYMLTRALELNQLDIKDIIIKHLDVNVHEYAYLNNEVDVVVNFEPVRTRLLQKGANEIFTSKEIYGEIVDVLVVHEDILKADSTEIQQVVNGWFEALNYLKSEPRQAARIMAKRLNVSPEEVLAGFDGLELPDRSKNLEMLGGKSPEILTTVERLRKVLEENRLLEKNLTGKIVVTDVYLSRWSPK